MSPDLVIAIEVILIPLAVLITYYDVRYRRIPNPVVVSVLISGLLLNLVTGGWRGLLSSVAGCALGFGLLLILRFFGAMGLGDVKLFAAIGALIGVQLVPATFVLIVLCGGVVAAASMVRQGTVIQTMQGVGDNFARPFRSEVGSTQRLVTRKPQTIPYGVAITVGSVISVAGTLVNS